MSSRYDTRTTTFSPEGRLYQVEYASEAISKATTAIGIVTKEGVVLATERNIRDSLVDDEGRPDKNVSGEKIHRVAKHLGCAVAGLNSDANTLVEYVRTTAARHEFQHQTPMPVEDIARLLCDLKQGYTQQGGMRPFGVSFLMAGYDKYYGYQLYNTDPSGNYSAWQAYAIGEGNSTATTLLKQHWNEAMSLKDAELLVIKILQRTMDVTELTGDRLEIATLTRGPKPVDQQMADDILNPHTVQKKVVPLFSILTQAQLKPLLDEAEEIRKREEAEEEKKIKKAEEAMDQS